MQAIDPKIISHLLCRVNFPFSIIFSACEILFGRAVWGSFELGLFVPYRSTQEPERIHKPWGYNPFV